MKINKIHHQKWFTLIELLVVITIIGILATGWVGIYTTQMQWARDSVRVQNMELLNSSLHQYYADKGKYPDKATLVAIFDNEDIATPKDLTADKTFSKELTIYNSNYPKDPKAGTKACWKDDATWQDSQCVAHYDVNKDTNGLPLSIFKIATRLEKATNVDADGIARTDNTETGKIDGRFEKFAGTGGSALGVWTYRIQ